MLAARLNLLDAKMVAGLKLPLLGSPKFDGIRGLVIEGRVISRKLIEIPNLHTQKIFGKPELNGLDGELILGNPTAKDVYRATDSAVSTIDGNPDLSFYVFDSVGPGTYEERLVIAEQKVKAAGIKNVILVPQVLLKTVAEVLAFEQEMVRLGYEGIMLRTPKGEYKHGRSSLTDGWLMKVKRFTDAEAEIIGFNQKVTNKNPATKDKLGYTKRSSSKKNLVLEDTLGSLVVRTPEGVVFAMKGSISDELAKEIWDNKDKYLGKWVKYKYFAVGVKDKPRHPIFLGFRSMEFDS